MAQAYAHPIVPLLSARDRQTQLLWGLQDFRRRFGHAAEGLWLPETGVRPGDAGDADRSRRDVHDPGARADRGGAGRRARTGCAVDRDSVDTCAHLQVAAPRRLGAHDQHRGLRRAAVARRSRSATPPGARRRSCRRCARRRIARTSTGGQRLVLCASDGELFGHHKKFADLTLAFATLRRGGAPGHRGHQPGRLPREVPADLGGAHRRRAPTARGRPGAARTGSAAGGATAAAACAGPTRAGTRSGAGRCARRWTWCATRPRTSTRTQASQLLVDPWGARDAYGEVVDASPSPSATQLLRGVRAAGAAGGRRQAARDRARLLLELQRATLLMYASCAWFFDDVAGLEASLGLRLARLRDRSAWAQAGGEPPIEAFLELLGRGQEQRARRGDRRRRLPARHRRSGHGDAGDCGRGVRALWPRTAATCERRPVRT